MHDHSIQCVHDPLLVTLSFLVAVLGSYTALQLALAIPGARTFLERASAVVVSGTAMGGGAIWAMHFIAMLACNMDVVVTYDIGITLLSAVMAMVACMVGLAIVGGGVFSYGKLVLAGLMMGLGVASMHYTGMAAMKMSATIRYDQTLVLISIVIAVVASIAALWLAFNMRGKLMMFGSAIVMGIAVCGMHYTAMLAAEFVVVPGMAVPTNGVSGDYLGAAVFIVSVTLLAVVLMMSVMRQKRRALVQI
jgi:NO-binding membrane sensor protein with MHYT domain